MSTFCIRHVIIFLLSILNTVQWRAKLPSTLPEDLFPTLCACVKALLNALDLELESAHFSEGPDSLCCKYSGLHYPAKAALEGV